MTWSRLGRSDNGNGLSNYFQQFNGMTDFSSFIMLRFVDHCLCPLSSGIPRLLSLPTLNLYYTLLSCVYLSQCTTTTHSITGSIVYPALTRPHDYYMYEGPGLVTSGWQCTIVWSSLVTTNQERLDKYPFDNANTLQPRSTYMHIHTEHLSIENRRLQSTYSTVHYIMRQIQRKCVHVLQLWPSYGTQ